MLTFHRIWDAADLLDELPKRTNQNYHDLLPRDWKMRQKKAPELEAAE